MDNEIIKKNEPTSTISLIPYFTDIADIVMDNLNSTGEKGLGEILFEASPLIAGAVILASVGVVASILIRRKLSSS